jgi:hypothetical protein
VPTGPFRFVGLIGAMTGNRNVHESELRVDYPKGGQVSLYGADNPGRSTICFIAGASGDSTRLRAKMSVKPFSARHFDTANVADRIVRGVADLNPEGERLEFSVRTAWQRISRRFCKPKPRQDTSERRSAHGLLRIMWARMIVL